jgi:hypothetical protein
MTDPSSRLNNPGVSSDGDVVKQWIELRRLLNGNPRLDILLQAGYLLKGMARATVDTMERRLIVTRHPDVRNGSFNYTIEEDDGGIITYVFEAIVSPDDIRFVLFRPGFWQSDLLFWFSTDRENARRKLAAVTE